MPAYTAAIVRRVSGGSADHSVVGVAEGFGGRLAWDRGAEAMWLIGDLLSRNLQQRPQAFGQGQQRPHGDACITPVGRHVLHCFQDRDKIGSRPVNVPVSPVGENDSYPVRTAGRRFRYDFKVLAVKGMSPIHDRDLSHQPINNCGSLR